MHETCLLASFRINDRKFVWFGSYVFKNPATQHMRVLDRFLGTRKFEARDSGFESKIGACFGIESVIARWDAKNNPRDYGIARNFGSGLRD